MLKDSSISVRRSSFTDRTVTSDDDVGRSVRRRAHAYQFNTATCRTWFSGGAVWLGPGDDNDGHDEAGNSADGSTFPETAANIIGDETGPETGNRLYNKKIFINNSTKSSNSENTRSLAPGEGSALLCACGPGSASNEIDTGAFYPPILKKPSQIAGRECCTFRHDAESAGNRPLLPHIASREYKLLDPPGYRTSCMVCGHQGSAYVEKLTPERKVRVDQTALRICRACYKTARKREQNEAPPLPGITLQLAGWRISKDIGRCSVCNLGKAVYSDRDAGTSICQHCYDRESGMTGPVEGGAAP